MDDRPIGRVSSLRQMLVRFHFDFPPNQINRHKLWTPARQSSTRDKRQPRAIYRSRSAFEGKWMSTEGYNSGLFDCWEDVSICCQVWFCCWTFVPSSIAYAWSMNESCRVFHCFAMAPPVWTRLNIRKRRGVATGSPFRTSFLYCCCCPCATCQDLREAAILRVEHERAIPPVISNTDPDPAGFPQGPVSIPRFASASAPGYAVPPGYSAVGSASMANFEPPPVPSEQQSGSGYGFPAEYPLPPRSRGPPPAYGMPPSIDVPMGVRTDPGVRPAIDPSPPDPATIDIL
jgi:Cys-rich protein (TIGR01571 family)